MSIRKAITKEGMLLFGLFLAAISLFLFLENKFPDATRLHLKISLVVFIVLYAGRWVLRLFKGLMLILFLAGIAGVMWILFKLS